MKQSTIKKILCTTLILAFSAQSSFAVQNYVITTTTNEQYSASSPVGRFENYTNNGTALPGVTTHAVPIYDYNYYQPTQVAVATPVINYGTPVYTAGTSYTNGDYNQTYSSQDIQTPQEYNKTVTTTEQCIDTREKADKVIDRGMKVVGTLAVVGAVAGLIIGACK